MPIIDFRQGAFAFLLIIAFSACKSDKQPHGITKQPVFSNEIKTLVHDMAAEKVVMGSAVGIAGVRPEQWDRYEKLSRLATDEELTALTDDTNVVVRCYAFQALVDVGALTHFLYYFVIFQILLMFTHWMVVSVIPKK